MSGVVMAEIDIYIFFNDQSLSGNR